MPVQGSIGDEDTEYKLEIAMVSDAMQPDDILHNYTGILPDKSKVMAKDDSAKRTKEKIYEKKRFVMGSMRSHDYSACRMQYAQLKLNDITGKLGGNSYTITTYDNYGNRVMTTTGDKINVQEMQWKLQAMIQTVMLSRDMSFPLSLRLQSMERKSRVVVIPVFCAGRVGKRMWILRRRDIESNASGKITDNTAIAGVLNKYKNMFGKARVVVIKSQLGQPIVAYSGEDVLGNPG